MNFAGFLMILFTVVVSVERTFAARRVDAHARARSTIEELHKRAHLYQRRDNTPLDIGKLFKLTPGEFLEKDFETTDVAGSKVERLHETYRGLKVYDTVVTVRKTQDGELLGDATGTLIQGIEEDLPDIEATLTDKDALRIATNNENDAIDSVGDVFFSREIYFDKDSRARLIDVVSYFVVADFKRPIYIIDMKTGEILKHWQGLTTYPCCERNYKAWGGNEKMGRITYGDMPYCLTPTIINGKCHLENDYVKVVDLQNTYNFSKNDAARFDCKKGYGDAVNGAYSPAVDAIFYGTVVGKMFEEWFQSTPLKEKVILKVHLGEMLPTAFWYNGSAMFGDGDLKSNFPYTLPDVVGHEIGHGVTVESSNLAYFSEHGGVNEAFSDILGEATEEYLLQSDFVSGQYLKKSKPYEREFQKPENDNKSISNVQDMNEEMDVHHSSGIYRRVWYVVTAEEGMSIRDVTSIFLFANKFYWHNTASFFECSCGVLRAALDLGFDTSPFRKAFKDVGLEECDVHTHVFSVSKNKTKTGVVVSATVNPVFKLELPEYADTFVAHVSSDNASLIQITVTTCGWEKTGVESSKAKVVAEGKEKVVIPNAAKRTFYIRLSSVPDEVDFNSTTKESSGVKHTVDFTAGFSCFPDFEITIEYGTNCVE